MPTYRRFRGRLVSGIMARFVEPYSASFRHCKVRTTLTLCGAHRAPLTYRTYVWRMRSSASYDIGNPDQVVCPLSAFLYNPVVCEKHPEQRNVPLGHHNY